MSDALLTYEEAAAHIADYAARLRKMPPAVEQVDLLAATGRTLAHPLYADRDQPEFPRSTRDGYACRAREASSHKPLAIAGATRAGQPPPPSLPPGAAWEIMTGAPVPECADAVMMIEHVEATAGSVRLLPPRTVEPGENIVARAAQARAGDELLPAGVVVNSGQIALAASCGKSILDVFTRPRVAILSTGDELVPIDRVPPPGQIRNSSSPMLAAMVAAAGGYPWILPIAADTESALDAALAEALCADLLLITGGVSAGKFDLVEPALARAGAKFRFTGARIQPGKPIVFAEIPKTSGALGLQVEARDATAACAPEVSTQPDAPSKVAQVAPSKTDLITPSRNAPGAPSMTRLLRHGWEASTTPAQGAPSMTRLLRHGWEASPAPALHPLPVFGLPGNPISSAVTFLLFATPVLAALAGRRDLGPRFALARLSAAPNRHPRGGLTRFLPALCTFGSKPSTRPEVALVPWQGSGDLAALARSNCFLVLPDDASPSLQAGAIVRILIP
jgi:molybdopterin molybdotransferase